MTSAPKLTVQDPPSRVVGAPRPGTKTVRGTGPGSVRGAPERTLADKGDRASADKGERTAPEKAERSTPEKAERPAPEKAERPAPEKAAAHETAVVPGLRSRRDHSKSPGFYSTVSPAHGATAVSGQMAAAHLKKSTVVGLAPPPEPVQPASGSHADIGAAAPGSAAAAASATSSSAVTPVVAPAGAAEATGAAGLAGVPAAGAERADAQAAVAAPPAGGTAAPDDAAPPRPCSTPPSDLAVARSEKEETSPGLGNARSLLDRHGARDASTADLELLLGFALDLALGCASPAWLEPLRAAVSRLSSVAQATRNSALEKALNTLSNDLGQAKAFAEENRQRLYGHVVAVDLALAKRIDVTAQKAIRERLIVDQLLEEVALSHPLFPRRLRDQGLSTLEGIGRLSAAELSEKLESTPDQAALVAGIFQGYLEQRVQRGPAIALLGKTVALRERLTALEASAEAFERASESEDSNARRRTRRQRQTDVAQLNLLLAEFGEAKALAEIERCSVQAKIERLQRWIGEQEAEGARIAAGPLSSH